MPDCLSKKNNPALLRRFRSAADRALAALAEVAVPSMAGARDIGEERPARRANCAAYDGTANASRGHTADNRATYTTDCRPTQVAVLASR